MIQLYQKFNWFIIILNINPWDLHNPINTHGRVFSQTRRQCGCGMYLITVASTAVMFWQTWLFHTFRGRAHANVGKFQYTEPFPGMQKVTTTQPLDAKKFQIAEV